MDSLNIITSNLLHTKIEFQTWTGGFECEGPAPQAVDWISVPDDLRVINKDSTTPAGDGIFHVYDEYVEFEFCKFRLFSTEIWT